LLHAVRMEAQSRIIFEEIRQLISQYCREVPGGRRAWPESIKIRVVKLFALGVPLAEISKRSELSYHTILNWVPQEQRHRYRARQRKATGPNGHFTPVTIQESQAIATVTVAKGPKNLAPIKAENATVTVTLLNGIRIEGVTAEFLRSWIGQGGGT
jgi:transposase-like protein